LDLPEVKAIKPSNRWNIDEAGIMEGQGVNGLVVGSTNRRFVQKKQPGSRTWTSFIEGISALGRKLPPLVIFKGKSVQQQWFPKELESFHDWHFTATENGWTTNDTAVEWLTKVFIPSTQPQDPNEYRLLILDGHGSHESTEFIYLCFEYKIYLIYLPPHTSHVLQPLDLSIFACLKRIYRRELGNLSLLTDSTPIGKRNFLRCYYIARNTSLTVTNIKSGWQASGLWPQNIAKPLMSRLLLENGNAIGQTTSEELIKDSGLDWSENISFVQWETPRKAKDIHSQANTVSRLENLDPPTQRQLFRKITKGFDEKDFALAEAELQIQKLKEKIEQLQPRKRRKVQTSPNSKFADVRAIKRAQIEAGDTEIEEEDSDSSIESTSTGDFIEVED
jgi:4-hydroxybenzoate polyprenyltransferase